MNKGDYEIRLIRETDVEEVLAIYAPYVEHTHISFEYDIPTLEEYLGRIRTNTKDYPWLVCLFNGKIIGYAYAGKHRYRTAYQWSPESTIYLAPEAHRKGIGRILYQTLFDMLHLQGHFNVYAGVGLPNEKSIGFHKALGFYEIGVFKNVGYKLGEWHDTHWFQLHLAEHIHQPPAPLLLADVTERSDFKTLLESANVKVNN